MSVSPRPGTHLVPAAMAICTDQVPLAQRWKEVPATQFQAPSLVQAVPGVMAVPPVEEPEVPVPAGVEAEVVVEGLEVGAAVGAAAAGVETAAGVEGAAAGVVAAAEEGVVMVMKTPPGRLDDGELSGPVPVLLEGRVVLSAG